MATAQLQLKAWELNRELTHTQSSSSADRLGYPTWLVTLGYRVHALRSSMYTILLSFLHYLPDNGIELSMASAGSFGAGTKFVGWLDQENFF